MTESPHWAAGLRAGADFLATLVLAGISLWHYLLGEYDQILLPAALACLMLVATLVDLRQPTRASGYLLLVCGYLLAATQLPALVTYHAFWIGVPVALTLLILPLAPAVLINLLMFPLWVLVLDDGWQQWEHTLAYLSLVTMTALSGWEYLRQRDLARATDPADSECDAVNRITLHERLAGEFQRAQHLDQRLAVLLLHLPQLDMASEQFGARAQLSQLDLLCRAVRSHCRDHDILGRENHADFWLVLPNTTESGALLVLKRLEQALDETRLSDTGPLNFRTRLCSLSPGEPWSHFEQRLLARTQSLSQA